MTPVMKLSNCLLLTSLSVIPALVAADVHLRRDPPQPAPARTCTPAAPSPSPTGNDTFGIFPGASPKLSAYDPFPALDNGPLACLVTSNGKLCLPPGSYAMTTGSDGGMLYDFNYSAVNALALPAGGSAAFQVNGAGAPAPTTYVTSRDDPAFVAVVAQTAQASNWTLNLAGSSFPPLACFYADPDAKGAVKCFGPGQGAFPTAMLGKIKSLVLAGQAAAQGYAEGNQVFSYTDRETKISQLPPNSTDVSQLMVSGCAPGYTYAGFPNQPAPAQSSSHSAHS